MGLTDDAARVLEMLEYYANDETAGVCRYTDARTLLGGSDERAQATLRRLELDGEIVWLGSGVLFPNRFPWSRFARRTLARGDDAGPARGTPGDARAAVRSDAAAGGRGA